MEQRTDDDELAKAIADAGFTPRLAQIGALLGLLAGDERTANHARRALVALGKPVALHAIEQFAAARAPLRGRLCRLVGQIAAQTEDAELTRFLRERLRDFDPRTQRAAIVALGRLGGEIDALLGLWDAGVAVEQQRALAKALGGSGDERALERLRGLESADPELRRIRGEALLKLERTLSRSAAGRIDLNAAPPGPTGVVLYCRQGLERFAREELPNELAPRVAGAGRVVATLEGSLDSLFVARTALGFGFPLATLGTIDDDNELGRAVAGVIASEASLSLLRALTLGGIRYRIEWASAGRRRALTHRVAERVQRLCPELVNDPRAAAWEVVVEERARRVEVTLRPHQLEDPRFSYRKRLLPAASHPTVAAALARAAGASPDDVVWDPFVGSATELIERARLGPYRRLYGTDIDAHALDAARENLRAAGVHAELAVGAAETFRPPETPTLVLTNPPLGRRLRSTPHAGELCARALEHAAELLAPGGRLVLISPASRLTLSRAQGAGLLPELRQRVDMGGFHAELQRFVKPAAC